MEQIIYVYKDRHKDRQKKISRIFLNNIWNIQNANDNENY